MSENIEKLKDIGVQKIHEATHIARKHVQALLNENFEDMNSIQFLGFISILEREFNLNLNNLKSNGISYFSKQIPEIIEERKVNVFATPKKKRTYTLLYIIIGVLVFVVFSFLNIQSMKDESSNVIIVDNSAIQSAKNNISADANESADDTNSSLINEEQETIEPKESIEPQEQNTNNSFKIISKNKVWLGYIDLDTHKKNQTTFSGEFSLDPSKNWLLAFGHGHISIEINEAVKKFSNPKNVRFSYINTELKEINFTEFKSLNRGSEW